MGTQTTEKQSNTSTSPMKQSVSLTSLPPSPGQQDVADLSIAAKLRIERPYNSLKVSFTIFFFIRTNPEQKVLNFRLNGYKVSLIVSL